MVRSTPGPQALRLANQLTVAAFTRLVCAWFIMVIGAGLGGFLSLVVWGISHSLLA